MSENHIPAKDAAILIGIAYFALIRRIHRDKIKGVTRDGRRVFIPKEQVERLAKIKQLQDAVES
jgi:predicted site-specific integrase-resolvase